MVNGTRRLAVDPRRRLGRHPDARRLLAADDESSTGSANGWGGLVSALQRHTVHSELARLPKSDRHILSLAYVQGHTNREIAAMLQVSVRTVGRRLTTALGRLEESALRAGAWISGLALLGLAAYSRWAAEPRSNRWSSAVAMAATGTATAVAVGFAVANPEPTEATAAPVTAMPIELSMPVPQHPFAAITTVVVDVAPGDTASTKVHGGAASQHAARPLTQTTTRICGGNPTNAPPATPVGPRGAPPHSPPVTTPGPGGCGQQP